MSIFQCMYQQRTFKCLLTLGAYVEVYCDSEQNLKGIFFQDQQMLEAFKAYPERFCIDATYKLLELRFTRLPNAL